MTAPDISVFSALMTLHEFSMYPISCPAQSQSPQMLSTSKYSNHLFWFDATIVKYHKRYHCFPLQFSSCCLFTCATIKVCQGKSGFLLTITGVWTTSWDLDTCLYMLKVRWNKLHFKAWFSWQKAHLEPWRTWNTSDKADKCHTWCHLGVP